MRKSVIFETIYKELVRIGKLNKFFTRNDLCNLNLKHQKFSVFVYKHSDEKNLGNFTLYFERRKKRDNLISFKIDFNILKNYKKVNKI
jgi:hypothetical protein